MYDERRVDEANVWIGLCCMKYGFAVNNREVTTGYAVSGWLWAFIEVIMSY